MRLMGVYMHVHLIKHNNIINCMHTLSWNKDLLLMSVIYMQKSLFLQVWNKLCHTKPKYEQTSRSVSYSRSA